MAPSNSRWSAAVYFNLVRCHMLRRFLAVGLWRLNETQTSTLPHPKEWVVPSRHCSWHGVQWAKSQMYSMPRRKRKRRANNSSWQWRIKLSWRYYPHALIFHHFTEWAVPVRRLPRHGSQRADVDYGAVVERQGRSPQAHGHEAVLCGEGRRLRRQVRTRRPQEEGWTLWGQEGHGTGCRSGGTSQEGRTTQTEGNDKLLAENPRLHLQ